MYIRVDRRDPDAPEQDEDYVNLSLDEIIDKEVEAYETISEEERLARSTEEIF